jgi:lipid-A-disaccharide synthase
MVVLAASLPTRLSDTVTRAAQDRGLAVVHASAEEGAAALLTAFDVALVASGTASLEAALAGAPPVVVARLDRLAYAVAKRLVRTPHVALPNVVLGRRAFPELVQDEVTPEAIVREAATLLDAPASREHDMAELRARLAPPDATPFGERVARLLAPWIE